MPFDRSYAIPAKPAPVFDALTSALHLRVWFAEQVEVGSAVGGPFRFWGRHTLWVPAPGDAKQTLRELAFPGALAFLWTWNGVPSQVSLALADDGEGTRVRISHAREGAWPAEHPDLGAARAARQEEIVAAFWDVAMANLSHYLFEGEPLLLPDFSASGEGLELAVDVEAGTEDVFRALTEPQRLDTWVATGARVALESGGEYAWGWTGEGGTPLGPAEVVAFRANEALIHDFHWPGEAPSRVHWQLEEGADGTRITLAHARPEGHSPVDRLSWVRALLALRASLTAPA